MSYEEYLNEEAVVLEEEASESIDDTATETEELVADEVAVDAEPDAELYDASADDEMEIEFEIEGEEKKEGKVAGAVRQARDTIQEKYDEARTACKDLMDRLSYDLKETDYNPYIRSTTTYKYEILRNSSDTEPVDVFEFERTSGFSLRSLAITAAVVAAADIAIAALLKKKG